MTDRFATLLAAYRRGESPPRVALAHLMVEAPDPAALDAAIARAAEASRAPEERDRLRALGALWRANRGAWEGVRRACRIARHDADPQARGAGAVAAWSAVFDALARAAPEMGVALHSLGDPEALAETTGEIVAWLRASGFVPQGARVADVGCGIGRIAAALAPLCAEVIALDVSEGMLDRARARCAGLGNVRFARTSGLDLAALPERGCDLVIFVDSFPYVVMAGDAAVAAHWRDAARALRPGGTLVFLNYAYGGAQPAPAIARLAARNGLALVESGSRPFRTWDAEVHALTVA